MTPAPAPKPGPLAKRIAAAKGKPEPWRPAWLREAPAKELSDRRAA